jgi:hypothetical protein
MKKAPHENSLMRRLRGVARGIRRHVFDSRILARVGGRTRCVCLGDSHIRIFSHIQQRELLERIWFDVVRVRGATALGIVNPNSQTSALGVFRARLARTPRWQQLLFMLGEVDCGFVIWYRAEQRHAGVDEQLNDTIDNYLSFLRSVRADGFQRIAVISAPLPTIADGQTWGEIANLRQAVRASQLQRTALTLRYNELLGERCVAEGIQFVDATSRQLDPTTGLVRQEYLNSNPLNHHLDADLYAQLIVDGVRPVLGT